MKLNCPIAIALILLLVAQTALADSVKLLNGEVLVGKLKFQDKVLEAPMQQEYLTFVADKSLVEQRIPTVEIDYVIVDRGNHPIVLVYSKNRAANHRLPKTPSNILGNELSPEILTSNSSDQSGIPLIVIGAIVFLVSATTKFGSKSSTMGPITLESEGTHYNGLNYAMMAIGAGLVFGGIRLESKMSVKNWQQYGVADDLSRGSFDFGPAVGFRLKF